MNKVKSYLLISGATFLLIYLILMLNANRYERNFKIKEVSIDAFKIIGYDSSYDCLLLNKTDSIYLDSNLIIGIRFNYEFLNKSSISLFPKDYSFGDLGSVDSIYSLRIVGLHDNDITSSLVNVLSSRFFKFIDSTEIRLPHGAGNFDCFAANKTNNVQGVIDEYNNATSYKSNFRDYYFFRINLKEDLKKEFQHSYITVPTIDIKTLKRR